MREKAKQKLRQRLEIRFRLAAATVRVRELNEIHDGLGKHVL